MRKILLGAVATLFLSAGAAEAANIDFGIYLGGPPVFEPAQFYLYGGRRYCWYDDGWHGPGFYWCGYRWRHGYGWGGPWGWHGWHHGYRHRPVWHRSYRHHGGYHGHYRGGRHGHHGGGRHGGGHHGGRHH
jgi:hypothetical protein